MRRDEATRLKTAALDTVYYVAYCPVGSRRLKKLCVSYIRYHVFDKIRSFYLIAVVMVNTSKIILKPFSISNIDIYEK